LSIPETEDLRAKARRLARQRKANRAFAEKRRLARAAAVESGKAVFLSPTEYCIATGLHPATVYRRVASGEIRAKKISKGRRGGRILIYADELARAAP
jgi:hypothetical protein